MTAPRRIDQPEPGFFTLRLIRNGWAVPCSIDFEEQTEFWTATIDGEARRHIDPVQAGVFRIWIYGKQIEAWRYADLLALKSWAQQHDPDHPCLHPRKPIDFMRITPVAVPRSLLKGILKQ